MVGLHIPGLHEVCNGEDDPQDNADTPYHDISDSKERVFAAHDCPGRYKDRFGATVSFDGEIYNDQHTMVNMAGPSLQSEISIWYVPALITSLSFRSASLLNVGSPAVLIHTWNSSYLDKSGMSFSAV